MGGPISFPPLETPLETPPRHLRRHPGREIEGESERVYRETGFFGGRVQTGRRRGGKLKGGGFEGRGREWEEVQREGRVERGGEREEEEEGGEGGLKVWSEV